MAQRSTRQRIEAKRKAQRKQSQLIVIGAVVLLAVLAVGVLILLNRPPQAAVQADADYSGLTQEIVDADQGVGFGIGDPDAPVTLVEYSDFSCPHCRDLAVVIEQLIDEYVTTGDLRIVFKPISFVNPPYSTAAAQAAVCAGEQGKFWEMHAAIWSLYDASGPGAYSQRQFAALAEAAGLDGDTFRSCYISASTTTKVQSVLNEAQLIGINSTPTMFLNGEPLIYRGAQSAYGDLKNAIEAVLGG